MEGFRRRVPFFKVRLNMCAKEDLRMWRLFLIEYNGVTMFLTNTITTQSQWDIQTATGTSGWAITKGPSWAIGTWGDRFSGKLSGVLKAMVP